MSERISTTDLIEYWYSRVQTDLTPFADPGTTISVSRRNRVVTCDWIQRGDARSADLAISFEGVSVTFRGQSLSYKSFFASVHMADLLQLAKMTVQARKARPYVDTRARLEGADHEESALTLIRKTLTSPQIADSTLLMMITGEAGAGKTSVLQELVRSQAIAYAHGQSQNLYLYINAQGRALARFTEAVAAELDELRSPLTFHQVVPLARLGLIVPVIDGFDELLGVGGYGEAISSIAAFVDDLYGEGQIIAASRSTYYEQEFLSRTSRQRESEGLAWHLTSVRVLDWGASEVEKFVRDRCREKQLESARTEVVFKHVLTAFSGENRRLMSKPLFVAQTTELVFDGHEFGSERDLLESLVAAYLEREQKEKLLDRDHRSILTSRQIEQLLVELAEEMWNQETRELDTRSAREIADFVLSDVNLDPAEHKVVVERMPAMAFLAPGERRSTIAFEHETFFAYFLAQRLASRIAHAPGSLSVLLGRSVLPNDVASLATRRLLQTDPTTLGKLVKSLGDACLVHSPRQLQVKENAGLVVQQLLCLGAIVGLECSGLELRGIVIPGGSLENVVITDSRFLDMEFRRVDLTQTKILRSEARDILLYEVSVDLSSTQLELTGLDPSLHLVGLRVRDGDFEEVFYDPSKIRAALIKIGAASDNEKVEAPLAIPESVQLLVERLARAYKRANPICTADDFMRQTFGDHRWPTIQSLLIRTGVVTEETRNTSGSKKVFLRRQVLPEEILAGLDRRAPVPDPVRNFWTLMEGERWDSH